MYTGMVRNRRLNIDIRYGIILVSGKLHGKVEGFLTQGNIVARLPRTQHDLASLRGRASRVGPGEYAGAPDRASAGISKWTNPGRIIARNRWTGRPLVWAAIVIDTHQWCRGGTYGRNPET
jgi:hypothetical protein